MRPPARPTSCRCAVSGRWRRLSAPCGRPLSRWRRASCAIPPRPACVARCARGRDTTYWSWTPTDTQTVRCVLKAPTAKTTRSPPPIWVNCWRRAMCDWRCSRPVIRPLPAIRCARPVSPPSWAWRRACGRTLPVLTWNRSWRAWLGGSGWEKRTSGPATRCAPAGRLARARQTCRDWSVPGGSGAAVWCGPALRGPTCGWGRAPRRPHRPRWPSGCAGVNSTRCWCSATC